MTAIDAGAQPHSRRRGSEQHVSSEPRNFLRGPHLVSCADRAAEYPALHHGPVVEGDGNRPQPTGERTT